MKRRFRNWVIIMKLYAREKRSVFSVIGYVDVKRHGSSRIARNLIPRSAEAKTGEELACETREKDV